MFKCRQGSCFLVAIEGADSVGKATQAALLEKGLNDKGIRAFRTEVPWGDNLTYDPIYKMLREGTALSEPVVFQALQACNRRTMQGTYLPNLSRHFDIVILDRWTLSTRVYGAATGVTSRQTKLLLDGVIEPDLTLVLDGEAFGEVSDSYEADTTLQQIVRQGYRDWVAGHQDAILFDARQDKEALACQLLEQTCQTYDAV